MCQECCAIQKKTTFYSQGEPGAPGKHRPTQRQRSKPGQGTEQRSETRTKTRTRMKNVLRSRQTFSLHKQKEKQQKVGTSFLLIYTLFPHYFPLYCD